MHQVVRDCLEELLDGRLGGERLRAVELHLSGCAECRDEVAAHKAVAANFRVFGTFELITPPAGFYAGVMRRIDAQQPSALWTLLFDPAFARKIAFASLLVLAALGGILVSHEQELIAEGPAAEEVLAADEHVSPSQETMLFTLASHR